MKKLLKLYKMFYRLLRLKSQQRKEIERHATTAFSVRVNQIYKEYLDIKQQFSLYEQVMRPYRICSPFELYEVLESDHRPENQSSAAEHFDLGRRLKQQENLKQFEKHEKRYKALLEDLENDDAGYASTQLHFFRTRCDELDTLTHHLFLTDVITFDQVSDIKYLSRRAHEIIKNRLQERILWLARGIDQTIENRKQNDTYKGEFTTAVILANAFNDIFYNQFGEFDIKEGENK
jgi:hypothetical protein